MIQIRHAVESDVDGVREVFLAVYGEDYAYPAYYDPQLLKKMIFADDTVLLVAEDTASRRIVGTASVLLDIGAYADLVAEFGRLAVHPDTRRRGIGAMLMEERVRCVSDRLHMGIVDNRVVHRHSQKIATAHGFVPVGLLPLKLQLTERESVAPFVQYFGGALKLRRNNPRVIPEVYRLSKLALSSCGLPADAIVNDAAPPYPHENEFRLEELTTDGYLSLMHLQRGRVHRREIFGPMQLHYGLFKIKAAQSNYLLARDGEHIVGAVGFTIDEVENAVRIFELVSLDNRPIHRLLSEVERRCRENWGIEYIDVDVSAFAPRMQRTLLELGFIPAAYIPAAVFHRVERLDVVRMVRLLVPPYFDGIVFGEPLRAIGELVVKKFTRRYILPKIAGAIERVKLFADLTPEQAERLAGYCSTAEFDAGEQIFAEGDEADIAYVVLSGEVAISMAPSEQVVGTVAAGESLGEMSLISSAPHSATATAETDVEVAALSHEQFHELLRARPDIAAAIYRNIARGLGEKLHRLDARLAAGA